jgi:hypothetical protein
MMALLLAGGSFVVAVGKKVVAIRVKRAVVVTADLVGKLGMKDG